MSRKIYSTTFIKESEEAIKKLDDSLSFVEEEINNLLDFYNKFTDGRKEELDQMSKTVTSSYEEEISKMTIYLSDFYTVKNNLLDTLDELRDK